MREQQEIQEIMIYRRDNRSEFKHQRTRAFRFDTATCTQFAFNQANEDELFFFTRNDVFCYNYLTDNRKVRYSINNPLKVQPNFGIFNNDQTKFIVTSEEDILFVDMTAEEPDKREIDLDDRERIGRIQNIVANDTHFFVLANMKDSRLGMYLLTVCIEDALEPSNYLINWDNKLEIGDCDLHLMTFADDGEKAVVVSYKSIDINTFNVFVISLNDGFVKFWHESYQ